MTFDYFLISAFARPFLRRIQAEIFGKTPEEITRIDLFPLPSVNPNDGKTFILNSPKYFCHYFSGNKGNYALRLDSCADLPLMDKTFKDGKTLFQTAMFRAPTNTLSRGSIPAAKGCPRNRKTTSTRRQGYGQKVLFSHRRQRSPSHKKDAPKRV